LGIIGRITMAYASSRLTTTMIRDMRNDMYAKLQEYSHHEYEQIGVSSLVKIHLSVHIHDGSILEA
ncbi:hypothetical protein, partial [Streptococcus agalactiae]|uniref:hypothetical protein n=1 Tax=Streptococcus agalactiae TaxID=1311 RepID=UPI0036327E4D